MPTAHHAGGARLVRRIAAAPWPLVTVSGYRDRAMGSERYFEVLAGRGPGATAWRHPAQPPEPARALASIFAPGGPIDGQMSRPVLAGDVLPRCGGLLEESAARPSGSAWVPTRFAAVREGTPRVRSLRPRRDREPHDIPRADAYQITWLWNTGVRSAGTSSSCPESFDLSSARQGGRGKERLGVLPVAALPTRVLHGLDADETPT